MNAVRVCHFDLNCDALRVVQNYQHYQECTQSTLFCDPSLPTPLNDFKRTLCTLVKMMIILDDPINRLVLAGVHVPIATAGWQSLKASWSIAVISGISRRWTVA